MDNERSAIDRGLNNPSLPLALAPLLVLPRTTTLADIQARTPARIFTGRAGAAYRTATWLELRCDHAAARDAVRAELNLERDLGAAFLAEWAIFEVMTLAHTKEEYLLQPHLGRLLSEPGRVELTRAAPCAVDMQVAIADGLSAAAVRAQVPTLLPLIAAEVRSRGWRFGQCFFIRHGRVGVLNEIGEILDPTVAVLLIGERPGLATVESLSAYMAYRPRAGHDDVRRNLISNIHARGVPPEQAAYRICQLAARMTEIEISGISVKEEWTVEATLPSSAAPKVRAGY